MLIAARFLEVMSLEDCFGKDKDQLNVEKVFRSFQILFFISFSPFKLWYFSKRYNPRELQRL